MKRLKANDAQYDEIKKNYRLLLSLGMSQSEYERNFRRGVGEDILVKQREEIRKWQALRAGKKSGAK